MVGSEVLIFKTLIELFTWSDKIPRLGVWKALCRVQNVVLRRIVHVGEDPTFKPTETIKRARTTIPN